MKWLFLIYSLIIHSVIAMLLFRISQRGSGVPGVFGWFFAYWSAISILTIVVLILRIFAIVGRHSLGYIFLGLGTFALGTIGLFIGIGDVHRDLLWICLYLATIVLGLIILSDCYFLNLIHRKGQT